MSDIKKAQNDMENYIEKYLPYNCQIDVIKMLNQVVSEPVLFNSLVDYQTHLKHNFIHEHLERLTGRAFSLDK